jgi:hypothetical protein
MAQRTADLLAQDPKFGQHLGGVQPLREALSGVGQGSLANRRILQRRFRISPERRAALQKRDKRIEQPRDVVGNGTIGMGRVKRLLASCQEPALQDLVPTGLQRRRDGAELSLSGEGLDPGVNLWVDVVLVAAVGHAELEPDVTAPPGLVTRPPRECGADW